MPGKVLQMKYYQAQPPQNRDLRPTGKYQRSHWGNHYSNITELKVQTKRNPEYDNKSYQARQRTELEKDDHRIQVTIRNTCNCINYQRIHSGEVQSDMTGCQKDYQEMCLQEQTVYSNREGSHNNTANLKVHRATFVIKTVQSPWKPQCCRVCLSLHVYSTERLMFITLSSSHTFYNGS